MWLAAQDANQTSTWQLVQDYFSHDIPVGAINLDSNWESGWTDFLPRTSAYPAMGALVDQFHSVGLRVICWATSMIDTDSPNFAEAKANNYLILNALNETGLMKWWHGIGALLDYTNPDAVEWWQGQMNQALSLGIDGWKNDGTDPFIMELLAPRTSTGEPISYRQYADAYYESFFDYSRTKIGSDALTMSRPVDSVEGVYLAYSPLRVMTSGWVGDNDASFGGLIDCAKKVLQSAWRGYANYGCDIGGYRIGNRTKELFLRWAAFGAFLPLMENGGENNHRPWSFDVGQPNATQTTDLYRLFVNTHRSLMPYLLSVGSEALDTQTAVLTPSAANGLNATSIFTFNPSTYDYLLGPSLFVSPVLESNVSSQNSTFPPAEAGWANLFRPSVVYAGGETVQLNITLDDSQPYPAFQRVGSILPLRVESDALPHHGRASSLPRAQAGAFKAGARSVEQQSRDSLASTPLTLFIPLSSLSLRLHAQSRQRESMIVRRHRAQGIEVEYTVQREACADPEAEAGAAGALDDDDDDGACYTLDLRVSASIDPDLAESDADSIAPVELPLLIVLNAAAEPGARLQWSSVLLRDSLSDPAEGRSLHAFPSLRALHSTRAARGGGFAFDESTGSMTVRPEHSGVGVALRVKQLRLRPSLQQDADDSRVQLE